MTRHSSFMTHCSIFDAWIPSLSLCKDDIISPLSTQQEFWVENIFSGHVCNQCNKFTWDFKVMPYIFFIFLSHMPFYAISEYRVGILALYTVGVQ